MNIQVLGAHNCESESSRLISLLIDDVLAIDAGALTSTLSFEAQQKLEAILLTHQHYDHIRDIPTIAINLALRQAAIDIYSTQPVYDALSTSLLDGKLYPRFLEQPEDNPTLKFTIMVPGKPVPIGSYTILPVPVNHGVPSVGYQVTSPDGKVVFYSGDTGSGLAECWQYISPALIITEVTLPDRYEELARRAEHLIPSLLKQELASFRELKGYLPQVIVVHMDPKLEAEIEAEIAAVAGELNSPVTLAHEGMQIQL